MVHRQITKTLLYSDIFDYPLTEKQIHTFLITPRKISKEKISETLSKGNYKKIKGYFFLKGRKEIIEKRLKKEKESVKKIQKIQKVSNLLKIIPGVKFLGISGSLSMMNADREDDIDLFIISSKNQIWSTRLAVILILKILGVYRNKNDKHLADKFCVNMIIDENNISFPRSRKDIYSAHEIVQLLPIFERENIYKKFIKQNSWIKKYMANFEPQEIREEKDNLTLKYLWDFLQVLKLENFSRFAQLKYMGSKKRRETVGSGFLAFHPNDPRKLLIKAYHLRLKMYNSTTLGH